MELSSTCLHTEPALQHWLETGVEFRGRQCLFDIGGARKTPFKEFAMTLHASPTTSSYRPNLASHYSSSTSVPPPFSRSISPDFSDRLPAHDANAPTPVAIHHPSMELFKLVLDEISSGVLLVTESGNVRYANRVAARALVSTPALARDSGRLRLHSQRDQATLLKALTACRVGRRSMLELGASADDVLSLAVVPMSMSSAGYEDGIIALVTLGRRIGCEPLSLQFFAQTHQLTQAESKVLGLLCEGMRSTQIASRRAVAMSTIRSQITSIREKTHTRGILEIIRMVSTLAPMVSALDGTQPTWLT